MISKPLEDVFDQFDDEFLKFERIENKLHQRPDIHAFLLLDKLLPGESDIVSGAAHDEIFLDADLEKLAEVATEDDIRDLIRCGVRLTEYDCLGMFA